jgi:hypothetical protein
VKKEVVSDQWLVVREVVDCSHGTGFVPWAFPLLRILRAEGSEAPRAATKPVMGGKGDE